MTIQVKTFVEVCHYTAIEQTRREDLIRRVNKFLEEPKHYECQRKFISITDHVGPYTYDEEAKNHVEVEMVLYYYEVAGE